MLKWSAKHPQVHFIALSVLAGITYVSLLPGKDLPVTILFDYDKLAHALAYAVFMTTASRSAVHWSSLPILISLLAVGAYGLIMEILQGLIHTDRVFDWWDVLANVIGAAVVGIIFRLCD